ncbi:MAG TPA: hypothetical protein VLE49_11815, partial [Anaerolineales bacterium]|nr:hypothetical protein [Anaerolineales bacterium]
MTLNETSTSTNLSGELARIWSFLTRPHPTVTEIGEKRRAQLIATISLILTVAFLAGLITGGSFGAFTTLLVISLVCYGLSRTRYYNAGSYFFAYGLTSYAYLRLYMGTAGGFEENITTIAHVSIVVASILLPVRGFVILVLLSTIATWAAPAYSQVPMPAEGFARTSGVFMFIGFILVGANAFRTWVERARLKEVNDINRELEDLTANLEQRVNERTGEIEKANEQLSKRATQLQTITELSESIAQLQDLN